MVGCRVCLYAACWYACMLPVISWPATLISPAARQFMHSSSAHTRPRLLPVHTISLRGRRAVLSPTMTDSTGHSHGHSHEHTHEHSSSGPRMKAKNPMRKAKVAPPATEEDMQEFVGVIAAVRNGNETEIPAVLARKVEFLLSRDISALMLALDSQCANEDERGELNRLFNIVIDFVEQFVAHTASLAEDNGNLLREVLEAAAAGMRALDIKMELMLSGQDPRYTPEFVRYLDAEIARLRSGIAARDPTYAVKKGSKRKSTDYTIDNDGTIDVGSAGGAKEEEEEEETDADPDAAAALQTLSVIKARISAEMERHLGPDAWAAQLLARLLQVDQIPLRIMALRTALGEMPDPQVRAQFYDVLMCTAEDVQDLVSQGQPVDPDLVGRLRQLEDATARELGLSR